MRIFLVIENSTNIFIPENRTWHRNFYEPLVEMGYEVVLFPAQEGRLAMKHKDGKVRAAFSQKLLETFRREHSQKPFSLFFAYLMDGMVNTDALDEIRKSGVPTCNFSCNNVHQFDLVDELSPHFEYNLHSEKNVGEKFLKIGANSIWWPMASNPKYFKPVDVPRTIQVSFVGDNYALRARYIANLLENGINVHAYGPNWIDKPYWRTLAKRFRLLAKVVLSFKRTTQSTNSARLADFDYQRGLNLSYPANFHAPIPDEEMITLYSRSHISLGFLEVYDRHDPSRIVKQHLHLREFEAPMSGALYCTGFMAELAEMFEPDREVIVYRNQYEMVDKVRYYLAHPAQAEQIRLAGRKRALADHTYHIRFRTLFEKLGVR